MIYSSNVLLPNIFLGLAVSVSALAEIMLLEQGVWISRGHH